jgi:hypothetical protein
VQEQGEFAAARTLLLAAQGDIPAALEAARVTLAQRGHLGLDDARIKEVLVVAVDVALTAGDRAAAEELLQIANERTQGHITHFALAHSMRFQARMADGSQDPTRTEDAWKGAIGLFREMALPFWTAVTLLEQAEWLAAQNRAQDADPVRDEAVAIFESLAARPWLDRANAIGVAATTT